MFSLNVLTLEFWDRIMCKVNLLFIPGRTCRFKFIWHFLHSIIKAEYNNVYLHFRELFALITSPVSRGALPPPRVRKPLWKVHLKIRTMECYPYFHKFLEPDHFRLPLEYRGHAHELDCGAYFYSMLLL